MKKIKFNHLVLFFLLTFSLAGCSHPNTGLTDPPPDPNQQTDLPSMQIFISGQENPIAYLGGLHVGDFISLEVRGNTSAPVTWFSSAQKIGNFPENDGMLYIVGSGRFLVRALTDGESADLIVDVLSENIEDSDPQPDPPPSDPDPSDPPSNPIPPDFIDEVTLFQPGSNAGFGANSLPSIVLGPPQGKGLSAGSIDVVSLGKGGIIILKSSSPILNKPGADFIVFENAFYLGGDPKNGGFFEPGQVSVSQDGVNFFAFPCDASNKAELYPGCAGVHPVLSNPMNGIDPMDPAVSGGDAFDLADLNLESAQWIKIEDKSFSGSGNNAGFDLDAIAILHH